MSKPRIPPATKAAKRRAVAACLIDPPGPFAPLAEWVAFRADLDRLDAANVDVEEERRTADKMIEWIRSGGRDA